MANNAQEQTTPLPYKRTPIYGKRDLMAIRDSPSDSRMKYVR